MNKILEQDNAEIAKEMNAAVDKLNNDLLYSVKLTKELNEQMHPKQRVYSPHSLPMFSDNLNVMEWSNNDEQYVIKLDLRTNIITGHYYDWDEEAQDWTDKHDVQMTAEQILATIKENHLLMVRGR